MARAVELQIQGKQLYFGRSAVKTILSYNKFTVTIPSNKRQRQKQ